VPLAKRCDEPAVIGHGFDRPTRTAFPMHAKQVGNVAALRGTRLTVSSSGHIVLRTPGNRTRGQEVPHVARDQPGLCLASAVELIAIGKVEARSQSAPIRNESYNGKRGESHTGTRFEVRSIW
jgi:hypothetical protein